MQKTTTDSVFSGRYACSSLAVAGRPAEKRERERQIQRDRQTETETKRGRRTTEESAERESERGEEREKERETEVDERQKTGKPGERGRDREIAGEKLRQTDRQTDLCAPLSVFEQLRPFRNLPVL